MKQQNAFKVTFVGEGAIAEDNPLSRTLYEKSRIGEPKSGKFRYSLSEGLFLLESNKAELFDGRKKKLLDKLLCL
jgi:hypothetical protein